MAKLFVIFYFLVLFPVFELVAQPYSEAPMLQEKVRRELLPPVEARLPDEPLVVEPVQSIGKYGGTWRRVTTQPRDLLLNSRMGYVSLVCWARDGRNVEPALASRWEVSADGLTYTFHLRKGTKWSDGAPFTTDDFLFTFHEIMLNTELSPTFPSWLTSDGKPIEIDSDGLFTLIFRFNKPDGFFLQRLAFNGRGLFQPAHYLKKFHAKYTDAAQIEKLLEETGFDHWTQLFGQRGDPLQNPECPSLAPWILKTPHPATRYIAERNPYFWKIDPAGNQLPYIDRIAFELVQNNELANFKGAAGDVDYQGRFMTIMNYTLFMENRQKGNFTVQKWENPGALVVHINQYSKQPKMREVLQDRRFRIALSLALDRDAINEFIYSGLGVKSRCVASPFDPYYLPEYDEKYLEFDPVKANALLDSMRLLPIKNRRWRSFRDSTKMEFVLHCYPSEQGTSADFWQLVVDYWQEIGLNFILKVDARNLSVLQVSNGNSDFFAYQSIGIHWVVNPEWYIPMLTTSYWAPLFGRYYQTNGKSGEKPPPRIQRLIDLYEEMKLVVADENRRRKLAHEILRQHTDECYWIGILRVPQPAILKNNFKNVPDNVIYDWRIYTPDYLGVEQFYFEYTR
ncbi:ABC transporter substrate-binding protein [candidate division KSB1 bacterium]|nr:ABC transporter substrate-binding protein [candidate division KSB1 bacterium]